MIAVDTNVLVYSHDPASPSFQPAHRELQSLAGGPDPWAIPWPCVYEFLRVTTHPIALRTPLHRAAAWRRIQQLFASPTLSMLSETARHADVLGGVLEQSGATGNLIHDAHIWSLCLEHGVTELLSGDRDFARFRGLKWRNPFA